MQMHGRIPTSHGLTGPGGYIKMGSSYTQVSMISNLHGKMVLPQSKVGSVGC